MVEIQWIQLEAINQLKTLGVRVIFEQEDLDTANTDSDLMISIIELFAQAENESRSDNIKWGIKQRAAQALQSCITVNVMAIKMMLMAVLL